MKTFQAFPVQPPKCRCFILDVPPEVFAIVLDGLERSELLRCRSVCRTWRIAALPYLYSTISITEVARISGFAEFLRDNPDVGQLVRRLVLTSKEYVSQACLGDILQVIRQLPRLDGLRVDNITTFVYPPRWTTTTENNNSNALSLKRNRINLLRFFTCFIGPLPTISLRSKLQPGRRPPKPREGSPPPPLKSKFPLQSIEISSNPQGIIQLLSVYTSYDTLKAFKCTTIRGHREAQDVGDFIATHGRKLVSLHLYVSDWSVWPESYSSRK